MIECASNSSSSKTTEAWSSYVPYPVQNSIAYFPEEVKNKCLEELELAQEKSLKENSFTDVLQRCNDFDTFSKSLFGETLQRIFLQPYNEKVSNGNCFHQWNK